MPTCGTELLARALLQLHSRDLCCQVVSDTAKSFVIKPKRKALFWDCLEKICAFSCFDLDPCFSTRELDQSLDFRECLTRTDARDSSS